MLARTDGHHGMAKAIALTPVAVDSLAVMTPLPTTSAPILCLHGLFAGAWVYDDALLRIAARGHAVQALSFHSHLSASARAAIGRQSIGDLCDEAAESARALDRPIVIGHSLGGLVAQMLVARNLARAAILISSAPPRGIAVLSAPLLARMTRYLPALLMSRAFKPSDADLDALVLNCVPVPDRAAIRDRLVPDSGRAARQAALGVVAVPVSAVRAPVLVVSGDRDRFVPLGVARRIAARYAVPLHIAPGHGHFLFAEPGWELHLDAMLDWIATLPSGAGTDGFA